MADAGGASALLVFPPNPFILGQTPEMVLAHFCAIADATSLPLIAFQYPLAGGQGYPMETLMRLVEKVPTVRAIKDWCNVVQQHERHARVLQSLPRSVNVLTTHSSWLLSSLVLGCSGLLSGMGSVVADLQSALFAAVQANDLRPRAGAQ
jgi:4-hydroxy-tetrahydrodipicolinate synthase